MYASMSSWDLGMSLHTHCMNTRFSIWLSGLFGCNLAQKALRPRAHRAAGHVGLRGSLN